MGLVSEEELRDSEAKNGKGDGEEKERRLVGGDYKG